MENKSTDQIPPRKDNWKLSDEPYMKDKRFDYAKAWKQLIEDFRSQPTRDITGRSNSYNPPMEQIEWRETNP